MHTDFLNIQSPKDECTDGGKTSSNTETTIGLQAQLLVIKTTVLGKLGSHNPHLL